MQSLWGEEFSIDDSILKQKNLLSKINNSKKVDISIEKVIKSKTVSVVDKLSLIYEEVDRILGKYKKNTIVIRDKNSLIEYINKAIDNNIISIDTETNNSLDTMNCKLMGACIYTPNMKNAYIPINHTNLKGEKLDNQLTEFDIYEQFSRLNGIDIIMHNAKFDYKVLLNTTGYSCDFTWDTMIGAKLLNENESAKLKDQYIQKIDSEQEKYDIEYLFKDIEYAKVDPEVFALYAATDPYITYKLYEYQRKEFSKVENKDIYNLFLNIEMPIIKVVANMELRGIEIDLGYAKKISNIYHKKLDDLQIKIDEELVNLKPIIDKWRLSKDANEKPKANNAKGFGKSKAEKLSDPIELSSPTQMAILLYDILEVGIVDKNNPRGTGAEILKKLKDKVKICDLLLEKRGIDILINTFIDKIPQLVDSNTGRLHANFNTYGADTGRFSSSDPNLQNIPSHSKDIRLMFRAKKDYCIVGADFSAQEPRSLASFSNDRAMLEAYEEDKDLYAIIGSKCFKNNYEDNLEFNPITGVLQPEGKERRNKSKTIQLAISYSMGSKALAEKINVSTVEAQNIINDFYKGFPGVKKFTDDSQKMLKELGYVTDMWGRRRHLPNATLKPYEVSYRVLQDFNPLLGSSGVNDSNNKDKILASKFEKELCNTKFKKDTYKIIKEAQSVGFTVKDNTGLINRAMRQCLNARIQSTAASMTKRAMILIDKDEYLNNLGFKLLITVHDEIFGECPRENSKLVADRVSELMVAAAKEKCSCKFKCDSYIVSAWYEDELYAEIKKDYKKLKNDGNGDIIKLLKSKYSMISDDILLKMIDNTFECGVYNYI